jgi:hypothetical protein
MFVARTARSALLFLLLAALCPTTRGVCLLTETQRLVPLPNARQFGVELDLSGDTLVVGAQGYTAQGATTGATFVFELAGVDWIQRQMIVLPDAAGNDGGGGVSLDGDRLVISAHLSDLAATNAGVVYTYHRTPDGWVQDARLFASDPTAGALFGHTHCLRGDLLVVGAPRQSSPLFEAGAAYVYRLGPAGWQFEAKLVPTNPASGDMFGLGVGLDGDRVVVGAWEAHRGGCVDAGTVYVFQRVGDTWTQVQELLTPHPTTGGHFGVRLAAKDGRLLVGASVEAVEGHGVPGAAYVYEWDGSAYTLGARLVAPDGLSNDLFGSSVAIDGDLAVVGAELDDNAANASGSAYAFLRRADGWHHAGTLTAADTSALAMFGAWVATDRGRIVVGAPFHESSSVPTGKAYVFHGGADCNGNGVLDLCELTSGLAADCDGDGLLDACEISSAHGGFCDPAAGIPCDTDYNANGIPDDCEATCGDFDGDNNVDVRDFYLFWDAFRSCVGDPRFLPAADADGDGCITLLDYGRWLVCYKMAAGKDFRPPKPAGGAAPSTTVPLTKQPR